MSMEYDYLFKLVVLGEPRVGKTSLIFRYLKNIFSAGDYTQTLGANFLIKRLKVSFNINTQVDATVQIEREVLLQIWDLAGHMRHTQVKTHFYQGAAACLLVYDVKDPLSYKNIALWHDDFSERAPRADFAVLANKVDLCTSARETKRISSDLNEISKKLNGNLNFKTSAKTGENVEKAFEKLATNLVQEAELHKQ